MLFCAGGDIHGAIEKMYDDVLAFETVLGRYARNRSSKSPPSIGRPVLGSSSRRTLDGLA